VVNFYDIAAQRRVPAKLLKSQAVTLVRPVQHSAVLPQSVIVMFVKNLIGYTF